MIVLDASIAASWYFVDEHTSNRLEVLSKVTTVGAIVPSHWRFEIANVFAMAVRRKRMIEERLHGAMSALEALAIVIDEESIRRIWPTTVALAGRWKLTVYDAAYLELALRHALPLATLDKSLAAAALEAGVVVLPDLI